MRIICYNKIVNKRKKKKLKINWMQVLAVVVFVAAFLYVRSNSSSDPADSPAVSGQIPAYCGQGCVIVNNSVPFFTEDEIASAKARGSFEDYGPLDSLGRCTSATCSLSYETMPAKGEKRGDISEIHPSAWKQARYDCVSNETVMTRTHLVGWMLSAENANERNLITGTRYMNSDIMEEWELEAARYIEKGYLRHVLYRVTPVFEGSNLMASGILMEAMSLEDNGLGLQYCVYLYNVQPGLQFDYSNGKSQYSGIFFDTSADSVRTSGINLQSFVMTGNTIHSPGCEKAAGGVRFKGDVAMVNSWYRLGYDICDCMG